MNSQALVTGIVDTLRRDILRGVLKPGTPVKERDTSTEMGVSRTPMREALRVLAEEGLITLRHARSPIVSPLDLKTVSDQTEVLITLERLSAKLACRHARDAELEQIETTMERMQRDFDTFDTVTLFELDMSFHSQIAAASQNASLTETHKLYLQRLWYPRFLAAAKRQSRERVLTDHAAILAPLLERDEVAAQKAVEQHLLYLADDIQEQVKLVNSGLESPSNTEKDTE